MGCWSKGGELLLEAMAGAPRSRRPTRGRLPAILLQIHMKNSDKGCAAVAVFFRELVTIMIFGQIYIERMEGRQEPGL
jgi:hypothetical protein